MATLKKSTLFPGRYLCGDYHVIKEQSRLGVYWKVFRNGETVSCAQSTTLRGARLQIDQLIRKKEVPGWGKRK